MNPFHTWNVRPTYIPYQSCLSQVKKREKLNTPLSQIRIIPTPTKIGAFRICVVVVVERLPAWNTPCKKKIICAHILCIVGTCSPHVTDRIDGPNCVLDYKKSKRARKEKSFPSTHQKRNHKTHDPRTPPPRLLRGNKSILKKIWACSP